MPDRRIPIRAIVARLASNPCNPPWQGGRRFVWNPPYVRPPQI